MPFLSICIPSYNRPAELLRLLRSIDGTDPGEIEIIIREDCAPARLQVREAVDQFRADSPYPVIYIENEENFGYDRNLRQAAKAATGVYVLFMGDDDVFVPGSLDLFLAFLHRHEDMGFVLRRYQKRFADGKVEPFRYAERDVFMAAGREAVVTWFRRSLFISGFTFRREWFSDYDCADFDGTLLFQLYILAAVCADHPSAYCDVPITESLEGGIPYFGASKAEKGRYISGSNPVANSLRFMEQVTVMTDGIERKLGLKIKADILRSYSKYSYGFLMEHRDDGRKVFRDYARELKKMGFACTIHFYIYYWGLFLFGKKGFHSLILGIKRMLGHTPRL